MNLLFIIGNSCRLLWLSLYAQAWGPRYQCHAIELNHAFLSDTAEPGLIIHIWMGEPTRGKDLGLTPICRDWTWGGIDNHSKCRCWEVLLLWTGPNPKNGNKSERHQV